MRKAVFIITMLVVSLLVGVGLSSCKKECTFEADTISGEIIKGSSVYPASGYTTQLLNGDYHVHQGHILMDTYKMSLNDGITKTSVDYNQYSILGYPMNVHCHARYERSVTIDVVNQIATYKIRVYQCPESKSNCTELRTVENFVLTTAIPESYTILYDAEIIEE